MKRSVALTAPDNGGANGPVHSSAGGTATPLGSMAHQLDPFARHLAGKGLASRTVTEYVKWVRRARQWLTENLDSRLADTHPWQVRRWVEADVPDTWASRKMARVSLDHWQTFTGHHSDLASAIPVPRKPRPNPRPIGRGDTQKIEQAAFTLVDDDSYLSRAAVATALGLYLGMRRVEIARATWESDGGDRWTFTRAKTRDVVTLPVHPRLRDVLDRHTSASSYLFVGRTGGHVSPSTVWQWVRDVAAEVNVKVTCHQLRHEAITRVVEACDIRVGQEFANHRDPEVTAGYAGVREQQLEQAVESLDWSA